MRWPDDLCLALIRAGCPKGARLIQDPGANDLLLKAKESDGRRVSIAISQLELQNAVSLEVLAKVLVKRLETAMGELSIGITK